VFSFTDMINLAQWLFIRVDVFVWQEYSKWNHPPFWSYVRLISYLHITQVITKLHGGSQNIGTAINYTPKYQVATTEL
jgi:hypothetical protein